MPETLVTKLQKGIKRIIAAVIILFFMLHGNAFSQCRQHIILNQSVSLEGYTNGIDNYYRNLIIQDLALAGQQSFQEIFLRFDYKIQYFIDQCKPGQIEIRVMPINVVCLPLIYHGYDVSASVKPEKADLIFQIINFNGFVTDSVIFFDIPLEKDSGLYSSQTASKNPSDSSLAVTFARAAFHYTKSSYESFRDRILQIDRYYAAAFIADSAIAWVNNGFLAESSIKPEMILRQVELERIMDYIRPDRFDSVLVAGQPDIAGLNVKFQELVRLNTRLKAIIYYNHFEASQADSNIDRKELLNKYLDWLDFYHEMAFKTDFSFVNFIEGLARPQFSNTGYLLPQQLMESQPDVDSSKLRLWCEVFVQCLIERGNNYSSHGDQLRALTYYESACDLSRLVNLGQYLENAFLLAGRMKHSIATSYLEISKKSALKDNPGMAAQYYKNASELYSNNEFSEIRPTDIREFELWLYHGFESQVIKLIELKEYKKALVYLNEINSNCMISSDYPCPFQYHDWMRIVRDGIYNDLLDKAITLLARDELPDAEQLCRQAIETRMKAGYRIEKDVKETELENRFRQSHYDDLIEEGVKDFAKEEFGNALYYFNKAYFQERGYIFRTDTRLPGYRQIAARHIIDGILSNGRIKAWAFDFEGAESALAQVRLMLKEYRIAESDTLSDECLALADYINKNECEMVFRDYNNLMANAKVASDKGDFILALKTAEDAVNLSMNHISCRIRDDEAWYMKIVMEAPSMFQQKEKELDALTSGPFLDYLTAFQELKNYYYRNKLLEQGVVFIPLFDRVIKVKKPAFLAGMLDHYIELKDVEAALKLLKSLYELGYPANLVKEQQKWIASALAVHDAVSPGSDEPWKILDSYTGHDRWYNAFSLSYKTTWLKSTHWKIKYWPVIWKNKFNFLHKF